MQQFSLCVRREGPDGLVDGGVDGARAVGLDDEVATAVVGRTVLTTCRERDGADVRGDGQFADQLTIV